MGRVAVESTENWLFSTSVTIRVTDLNYGNHLGNQQILGLFHEARVRWLKSLEQSELNFFGCGLIMADCAMQFKSEGFLGDKMILKIGVSDTSSVGFTLVYKMERVSDSKTIALCQTGVVCFDYESRKVARLPQEAIQVF